MAQVLPSRSRITERRAIAAAALLVAALAAPAPRVRADDPVSLDRAIHLVRDESPAARAVRARIDVAVADADVAGVLPNPQLGYLIFGRVDGTALAINGSQHQPFIEFPVPLGGQPRARRNAAAADAQAVRAEVELELLALETEARRAFATLLAAQERTARLAAAREALEGLSRAAEAEGTGAEQSRYDRARIRIELARIDARLGASRADEVAASGVLAALAGRAGWRPRARGRLDAMSTALHRPHELLAVRVASQRVAAAELHVTEWERERIPQIRVGVGAYATTNPDSLSLYASLGIPLPVFDTGSATVDRARAVRDATQVTERAVVATDSARVEALFETVEARRSALERFDRDVRAVEPLVHEMADASSHLGAGEVLDTLEESVDLDLTRIDLTLAVVAAETEALALTGR